MTDRVGDFSIHSAPRGTAVSERSHYSKHLWGTLTLQTQPLCVFRGLLVSRGQEACPGGGETGPARGDPPDLCPSTVQVRTLLFSPCPCPQPSCSGGWKNSLGVGWRSRGMKEETSGFHIPCPLPQDPWRPLLLHKLWGPLGDTLSISCSTVALGIGET